MAKVTSVGNANFTSVTNGAYYIVWVTAQVGTLTMSIVSGASKIKDVSASNSSAGCNVCAMLVKATATSMGFRLGSTYCSSTYPGLCGCIKITGSSW